MCKKIHKFRTVKLIMEQTTFTKGGISADLMLCKM